ncbi:unnamed protein product [Adineta steineri]|uniref:Uncharacterized protein n=1 Tax=Adineta steineri TaxID=433720 RepID=A0A814MB76_9BILA|nr:unnamed protein product [Adineta steineri]
MLRCTIITDSTVNTCTLPLDINEKPRNGHNSSLVINWLNYDPENPKKWSTIYKWLLTLLVSVATLAVTFCSSAYTGPFNELRQQFHASDEVITLGVSLYVLSLAIGPNSKPPNYITSISNNY